MSPCAENSGRKTESAELEVVSNGKKVAQLLIPVNETSRGILRGR